MSNGERIMDIARAITGEGSCDRRIDSLDLTEIILEVEDEFDLIVEDEESIQPRGCTYRIIIGA